MYEGRTNAQSGIIFGHENMSVVVSCDNSLLTPCMKLQGNRRRGRCCSKLVESWRSRGYAIQCRMWEVQEL